ncbi:MAG: hypothetical protein IKA55_06860 [Akkermansia sp.]|nr:hypothetical protein [Akkermansia sp.]
MNKTFTRALTCLLAMVSSAFAVQLSDLSPSITRESADDNLTKDYAYRVMSDLSIRRIWNLDDNRKLSIDFDAKKGDLICIVVDYRVPVTLDEADRDAADIGKFEEAAWRKFAPEKAAKYYMGRSRAMKFKEGYMFEELSGANKCLRLTFYPKVPKENRRHLSTASTSSATSIMGSSVSGRTAKALMEDEEKRLYTPNKTDKPAEVRPVKKPAMVEEVTPDEPSEEPEVIEEVEPTDEPVIQTPVKVKPVKTVKQKGDRDKDVDGFLAKLGLDKLEPIHWILGGVGLVILITIISAVGRSNERRRMEARAARLRNNSASVKASLKQSVTGAKPGKLKLK